MSCGYQQCLAVYVAVFLGMSMLLPPAVVDAAARFTQEPPSKLYVVKGGTARFVWDYQLDGGTKLDSTSPGWYFYDPATKRIGYIDKYDGWTIDPNTCPARLRSPTVRVRTESKATLVITSVTTADNGVYGCRLGLSGGGSVVTSKVQLIVTETPTFTVRPNPTTTINEDSDLSISCTSVGPPTSNVTWVQVQGVTKVTRTQGVGSATLSIPIIKRDQNGTVYECQAVNNPNQSPVTTQTVVIVYYKPNIDQASSTNDLRSWKGHTITLQCVVASGFPSPNFTWYKPNGDVIPCNQCSRTVSSQVVVQTGQDSGDYGLYRCIATNVVGSDQHYINVTQLFPPGSPNITVTDIEASSVIVRWIKPVYDGGSPVIAYRLVISDSKTITIDVPNTHKSITGLTKNTKYEVKLSAKNMAGYGSASSKVFTTKKQGPPSLPEVKIDIHQTSVTLVWSKPDGNGGEITKYTIYKKVGVSWSKVVDVTVTSYTVENLDPAKKYRFIVTATNQYGESLKDDIKAVVLPVETTATPLFTATTTTAIVIDNLPSSSTSADIQNLKEYYTTVVGVLSALLAVSLLVNILLVLYMYRNARKTMAKTNDESIYENAIAMAKTSPSSAATLHVPPASQPGVEYESVQPSSVQPQYEIPPSSDNRHGQTSHYQELNPTTRNEIPDNTQTSQHPSHYQHLNPTTRNEIPDNTHPSHYQQLNPMTTIISQHGDPIGMYEPLRLKPMNVRTGQRADAQRNTSFT